ncbi:hypothetical protein [Enterocloster phage PMBT24]|uniref:Uncharacterized protein n=1 Tax=Enterocloster phage PMBT24 TaxID=3025413 RepID=A0AAT9TTS8_9CAUD|nr:hypothetical protein [Enterocloster phage PMBT24]
MRKYFFVTCFRAATETAYFTLRIEEENKINLLTYYNLYDIV